MFKSIFFLLITALYLPASLCAQTMGFLNDSPIAKFTKEDHALFEAAMKKALDGAADGAVEEWSNPKTKAHGSVTPLKTVTKDGRTCRKLRVINEADGASSRSKFKFCKFPDGSWKVPAK